jgi:hypothetical protein
MNMINSFLGRMHLASHLELMDGHQLSLVRDGVEYYKTFSDVKHTALPFLPLGFAHFGDKRVAAGFRSEYKGIIRVDINEWVSHYKERHFVHFVEYLACYSEKWLIILTVDSDESEHFHDLESFLSMYLRLEKVTLTLPCTDDLLCYMERKLGGYGLSADEGAKALLSATVEKLKENKYFDGYKTLALLCQDIVYEVFSKERPERDVLTADMLSGFSCDSDYVKRTIRKIEKVNKIGF